jgi:hypothetical protein
MAGMAKVSSQPMLMEVAAHLGFTPIQYRIIGATEIAGAIGVLLGLLAADLQWLGMLAAAGLMVIGVGAFYFHSKADDEAKDSMPSLVLSGLALVFIGALASR